MRYAVILTLLCAARAADVSVSFSPDILSILTTKGCNGSNCHGAVAGKNGFKLSLFGQDPQADHAMIAKRVDRTNALESLLLKKPSFQIAHGGGRILPADSQDFRTMLAWIEQGARFNADGPRLSRLEIFPAESTLLVSAAPQPLRVTGHLSDGSTRDMTSQVRFSVADESIVKLEGASFRPVSPGMTTILARAMGKAAVARAGVIAGAAGIRTPEPNNFIDDLVFARLRRMNVQPAAASSDEQFLRRVYVDVLGRVPTIEERREFLASPDRARLIDRLLDHPEYVSYRTLKFEDWFRNTQLFSQGRPMGAFKDWLRDQVEADRPYSEVVRDLVTSSGDTNRNPPAGFWLPATDFMLNKFDVKMATTTVTRLFLGVRMECAECHNHPLENFTQDDFYGIASFFGRMRIKIGSGVYRRVWYLDDQGELAHPVKKLAVQPAFLTGERPDLDRYADRRQALAEWITSPGNPWFARATVNRLWYEVFRTGIVEPFDDFRSTNAPTNPELLDRLGRFFTENGFRLKPLLRLILNSKTYQLSSIPAAGGAPDEMRRLLFARYFPRKLPAEALLDSISTVTGVPTKFEGHPLGANAKDIYINDGPSYFLGTFGFPRRDILASRLEEPTLSQALHLMNRQTLKDKLESDNNFLARNASAQARIDEIFERAYSRLPRDEEKRLILSRAGDGNNRRDWENVLLVVINTKEFQLNH